MPTLPAFRTRVLPIMRSNCICVWPQTTIRAATVAKIGTRRSLGVMRVKISVSLRGVAWQKKHLTEPWQCYAQCLRPTG